MPSLLSRLFITAMKMELVRLPADQSFDEMRRGAQNAPKTWLPRNTKIEPVDAGGVPAEWLIPPDAEPGYAILYLHGGGYCLSTPSLHRPVVARIAGAARARALMIDYRLAPEHPFPAAFDDTMTAWRWMLEQGYAPGRVVVAGDSAGGHWCWH